VAVAAAEEQDRRNEEYFTLFACVAIGLFGLGAAVRFVRDTRDAMAQNQRPRQPWDV
jgi:hypothetical protein